MPIALFPPPLAAQSRAPSRQLPLERPYLFRRKTEMLLE